MIDLRLINHDYPVNQKTIKLVPYSAEYPQILMEKCARTKLFELLDDIKALDTIFPISAYRSAEEQAKIWNDSLIENGLDYTKSYVAKPNHSEHQSGLAIDLTTSKDETDIIAPEFSTKDIGGDFMIMMAKYGYILRYQKAKEAITHIKAEPWHFRYVGYPHSEIMQINNLCLEEYLEEIKKYTIDYPLRYHGYQIFYSNRYIKLDGCQISFNNYDGYIYTKE